MIVICWLAWRAADVTAWGCEHRLLPYEVYRRTALFAFAIDPEVSE